MNTYLITGGTSGIGLTTAQICEGLGHQVIITGRRQEALDAAELKPETQKYLVDNDRLEDIHALKVTLAENGTELDGVFINAGIFKAAPFSETPIELYNQLLDVNLKGSFFTAQALLPFVKKGGSIVFNTSIATQIGLAGNAAYAVSKGGLSALVKVMAVELAAQNIRVNALSPGLTHTPIGEKTNMPAEAVQEYIAEMVRQIPIGRPADAVEQAKVAYFLLSDNSSYISGQEIVSDGGLINA